MQLVINETYQITFRKSGYLEHFGSIGKNDSSKEDTNPFIKKQSTPNKFGKEVKIACCGCFPVSNSGQDD